MPSQLLRTSLENYMISLLRKISQNEGWISMNALGTEIYQPGHGEYNLDDEEHKELSAAVKVLVGKDILESKINLDRLPKIRTITVSGFYRRMFDVRLKVNRIKKRVRTPVECSD